VVGAGLFVRSVAALALKRKMPLACAADGADIFAVGRGVADGPATEQRQSRDQPSAPGCDGWTQCSHQRRRQFRYGPERSRQSHAECGSLSLMSINFLSPKQGSRSSHRPIGAVQTGALLQNRQAWPGLNRDTGLGTRAPDRLQRAVDVGADLYVGGDHRRHRPGNASI